MVVRKVWLSSISQTLMAPSADALLIVGGCVVVSAIRSFIACSFEGPSKILFPEYAMPLADTRPVFT